MKILVINPNTSEEMTKSIEETAKNVVHPGTQVIVTNPDVGPESIESFYEEHLSFIGVMKVLKKIGKVDAVVIACFDDPCLYAYKEILDIPVVGIGEASFALASILGYKFSIIVALKKAVSIMENLVIRYGLKERLASIRPLNIPVLGLEKDVKKTLEVMANIGKKMIEEDGAEVIILGCAGMTNLDVKLSSILGVPVIDPVKAGVKIAEMLAHLGLKTSKKGLYEKPPKKKIKGIDIII